VTLPVFDGHNDVLLRIHQSEGERSFFEELDFGHLDLPRARRGGFAGGLFAVFVPGRGSEPPGSPPEGAYEYPLASPVDPDEARQTAEQVAGVLFRLEEDGGGGLRVVRTGAELEECIASGVVAAVLHFEGAEPIGSLDELESWYERGLRSLGLVWSRGNAYAEGVPFRFPASPDTGPGLTAAGRELVHMCNRLGVLVDLSHLNQRGFFDVAAVSEAPLVASHSNAHALCPSTRNLADEQLDAIAASGGLAGVNFAVGFLREDGQLVPDTPLDVIVAHFEYLVERMGIDHVGFGSDFEGAIVPVELGDAAGLPRLVDALRARGYDEEALRKLAHGNWVRVLRETWRS
jgi:membrane dipeptidase